MRNQGEEVVLSVSRNTWSSALGCIMNQGSESGLGSKVMWGTESRVSPAETWTGKQNTKLSSDSWKESPACCHGLPRRSPWYQLEGSTAQHISYSGGF